MKLEHFKICDWRFCKPGEYKVGDIAPDGREVLEICDDVEKVEKQTRSENSWRPKPVCRCPDCRKSANQEDLRRLEWLEKYGPSDERTIHRPADSSVIVGGLSQAGHSSGCSVVINWCRLSLTGDWRGLILLSAVDTVPTGFSRHRH